MATIDDDIKAIAETSTDDATTLSVHLPPRRRLNLWPLVGVIFFIVCGGAYGLEPLVGATGAGWAVARRGLTMEKAINPGRLHRISPVCLPGP